MGVLGGQRPPNTPALPYHRGDSQRTHVQELCDKQYNQKNPLYSSPYAKRPAASHNSGSYFTKPPPFGDLERDRV